MVGLGGLTTPPPYFFCKIGHNIGIQNVGRISFEGLAPIPLIIVFHVNRDICILNKGLVF